MKDLIYRNRRAVRIENNFLRVTATVDGGHVAEILDKKTGVNPLWTPHWPSIEPSTYDRASHPEYGGGSEAQLLAGILGHNVCLDIFGAPSPEEAAAGLPVHGEGPVVPYAVAEGPGWLDLETTLNKAQLRFKRRISLPSDSTVLQFSEELENLSSSDQPIAWTQHVTLGPPFLTPRVTEFRASATKSKVIGSDFNDGQGMQKSDAEFDWPLCPRKDGDIFDFRIFTGDSVSGGFTAHLMDPSQEHAWFMAWSPASKVLVGYAWKREDFPWLARWEENHLRTQAPWNGQGLACGMEFGVSPFVESRRQMVERGKLFGAPTFKWAPARTCLRVNYCAFVRTAESIPESLRWDGENTVELRS